MAIRSAQLFLWVTLSAAAVWAQEGPNRPEAKPLTLDSKTNHVLLIGAEYVAAPPPATPPPAGGRGPARTMVPDSFSIVVVGK